MKHKNSKNKQKIFFFYFNFILNRIKKQNDHLKLRCLEHEQRIQQLVTLLNEKQILINDLNIEKR